MDKKPSPVYGSLELGFQFAISILLCMGAGYWLDRKLGSAPWLIIAGALLGFAAGFYAVVKAAGGGKK